MLTGSQAESVYKRVTATLASFFSKCGKREAVLGLSGGIDSAVVACIAADALGKESVHGLIMPSPFSTVHSVTDAIELAQNLEISYDVVSIDSILNRFVKELDPVFKGEPAKLTLENIQARIRGVLLMAYSNQTGALVLNTSNKSELSAGYGTLYGDLCGAIMVIADLYKMDVYEIARYINFVKNVIPGSTITKAPSAELSPGQMDSDQLPLYEKMDPVLYALNEEGKTPAEVIESGGDEQLVRRIVDLKRGASFKTHQLPEMIQLGDHPLLPGKCVWLESDNF
ncbi:MAG: NAD(+) synthase [Bacteroidales bacterium]|nr:NAD(+) synthase [Bacteroidales bacterium]MDD3989738.1 NAD(+) synthase [Bacteroidales bacterium]